MADYISREAASDLLAMALIDEWETEYAQDRLSEIPAADVVEVVRGKDCKHYKEGKLLGPTKFCYYYKIGTGLNTADDDYCSHGERRNSNA